MDTTTTPPHIDLQRLAGQSPPPPPPAAANYPEIAQILSSPSNTSFGTGGDRTPPVSANLPVSSSAPDQFAHLQRLYAQLQSSVGLGAQSPTRGAVSLGDERPLPYDSATPGKSAAASVSKASAMEAGAVTSRSKFESMSREMLVDYAWEVHQALCRCFESRSAQPLKFASSPGRPIGSGSTTPKIGTAPLSGGEEAEGAAPSLFNVVAAAPVFAAEPSQSSIPSLFPVVRGYPTSLAGSTAPTVHPLAHCPSSSTSVTSMVAQQSIQTTREIRDAVANDGRLMINQFVVMEDLGSGNFGIVKLAFDTLKSVLVAVKIMDRGMMAPEGDATTNYRAKAMQREIAVMKKLRHKNIVALYEVIDDPEAKKLYLVMQYIDDGAVATVAPDFSCVTYEGERLLSFARQMCAGLQYLHDRGIVHRDLKPDNILKDANGQVYLADFGVSEMFCSEDEGLPSEEARASKGQGALWVKGRKGTPAFMAPELHRNASNHALDGKAADVWSLGITLYCLTFGRLPFTTRGDICDKVLKLPANSESFPAEWNPLLEEMLRKDPSERPTIAQVRKRVKEMQRRIEASKLVVVPAGPSLGLKPLQIDVLEETEIEQALTPYRWDYFTPESIARRAKQGSLKVPSRKDSGRETTPVTGRPPLSAPPPILLLSGDPLEKQTNE